MLILEEKISFFERYNAILNDTLKPEIIYLDEKLIWKRFLKIFGISHLKFDYCEKPTLEVLENLSNQEIYKKLVKSCSCIIKEIL